ncbi:MAG: hypothetical protein KDA93_01220 [Planctomycetaceae bacterium]|nr:hypothetical protein [Planctomycetaceae bacterium]
MLVSIAEAGAAKSRRKGAIDRLKGRSATSRWEELRQIWRPSTDVEGVPVIEGEEIQTPQQEEHGPGIESEAPSLLVPATAIDRPINLPVPGLPALPSGESRDASPSLQQPVWHLSQDIGSRQPGAETEIQQTAAIGDVLPKPITSILPYYDYLPDGEDPCEYLCPRPEGCGNDEDAPPCPELVALPDVSLAGRHFVDTHVLWEPANLFHNPLYFEDHALERYGHTHHELLQPFVSVGKFGAQFIGLPYQMALHPAWECQSTLGWHRPGECVPYRYHLPPWNTKAALTAAGTYTGLIFLFP